MKKSTVKFVSYSTAFALLLAGAFISSINLAQATAVTIPAGLHFKYANDPTVYFVSLGCKAAYSSYQVFLANTGENQPIVTLPDSLQIQNCGSPTIETAYQNTVFRYPGSPALYILGNAEKEPITSMSVFQPNLPHWQ